jgi:hypothetical protein
MQTPPSPAPGPPPSAGGGPTLAQRGFALGLVRSQTVHVWLRHRVLRLAHSGQEYGGGEGVTAERALS